MPRRPGVLRDALGRFASAARIAEEKAKLASLQTKKKGKHAEKEAVPKGAKGKSPKTHKLAEVYGGTKQSGDGKAAGGEHAGTRRIRGAKTSRKRLVEIAEEKRLARNAERRRKYAEDKAAAVRRYVEEKTAAEAMKIERARMKRERIAAAEAARLAEIEAIRQAEEDEADRAKAEAEIAAKRAERRKKKREEYNLKRREEYRAQKERESIDYLWGEAIRENQRRNRVESHEKNAIPAEMMTVETVVLSGEWRGLKNVRKEEGHWVADAPTGVEFSAYFLVDPESGLVTVLWTRSDTLDRYTPEDFRDKYLGGSKGGLAVVF